MTTREIVKSIPKNRVVRMVVPEWAVPSIPFPFYRNGFPCLGIYFYPMKNQSGRRFIHSPIIQLIVSYPTGHIVGITASPFFLFDKREAGLMLGEYPNAILKNLSLAEGDALYDKYYASCDSYFDSKDQETWGKCFTQVKEEGMERFFTLFTAFAPVPDLKRGGSPVPVPEKSPEKKEGEITRPVSIAAGIKDYLREVQTFFSNPIFAKESREISRIIAECSRSEYNIAVIGEFSRGKTSFLNDLLGLDCLPVGDLPTTAVLTKIHNGPTASVSFIDKARKRTTLDLSLSSLEKFLADDQGNDPEGVLQITTPIDWLGGKNIAFFDTPGAGDVIGKRADIVRETIGYCDYSIMAVSAQAACSMTEMEFLKANVVLKATPHCAILISKLDTIPEVERSRVIDYVKKKVTALVPNADFWVSREMSGVVEGDLNAFGIENIRKRIVSQISSDAEALYLREQQLIARTQMVLAYVRAGIKLTADAGRL